MIEFNSDLINDLARRRTVLFLGAGVSASALTNTGTRFKQWGEFLLAATEKLPIESSQNKALIKKLIREKNFLFANELLKSSLKEQWPDILTNEFNQIATPSRLHNAIISLDQRILITTNFDTLLEVAWEQVFLGNSSKSHHPAILNRIDGTAFKMLRDDGDYIIKLHGDINDVESIVFDTSSYQKNAYGNTYYKELLNSLLLTHTFLFIGFSMADPAISLFVEMYAHRFPDSRPHYILVAGKIS